MKSDPEKVDSFFERLGLKPAASTAKATAKTAAPQRARRAPGLVMRMDGWQIAGHVVIMPEGSPDLVEKLLATSPPKSRSMPASDES